MTFRVPLFFFLLLFFRFFPPLFFLVQVTQARTPRPPMPMTTGGWVLTLTNKVDRVKVAVLLKRLNKWPLEHPNRATH